MSAIGRLRLFLVLLIVDWTLGTPGLGIETRPGVANDLIGWVYAVAFLALIGALALTWLRRRYAPPLAMAVGALAVMLAILDVFGVTSGAPAPAAMVAVDAFGLMIGAAIVWSAAAGRSGLTSPA
jgi:hypothetical protein